MGNVTFRDVLGHPCHLTHGEHGKRPIIHFGHASHRMKLNQSQVRALLPHLIQFANPVPEAEPGIENVDRDYATVHIRFQTPEQAVQFQRFIEQEINHGCTPHQ